ncbi:hypothetical protein BT96DRAFT_940484 [Gymnopus androsaceus JB14]|uniref:Uncharacterized protein n=1 Tax=Gymnopus androsaceus JB14 TaxID=1447944 RepID=A0A6A4HLY8_9AGAR|nr:hypothetical protein BT96DRAFT_940484 [Gymnopus androsaceus JB14]
MEGSFVGRRQWDKEAKDLIESHTFAVLLGVGSIVALFGVGCGVVQEHWWTLDAQGAGHGSKVGKDERLTNHLVGALTLAEKKNDDIMVFFLGQSNRADQTISKPFVSSNFTSTYVGARARPYSRSLMAQPSRKDALNLARSFIVTEADEDSRLRISSRTTNIMTNLNSRRRIFAGKKLNPYICEAQPRPFKGNALSQLNDYDSDSDSDTFVPPTASPAPPAVISSVSAPPAVPPASAGPSGAFSTAPVVLPSPYAAPTLSSPNHDREMEAWVLLDKYLTSDSGQGGQVHAALEKLCVGAKWDDVWGRITGMEPGDEDAATAVRNALDSIKPTVPGPTLLSDRVDSAHLEDFEVGEGEELTEEQKELAEYLNKFSDSVMLEEYGIYYVRCRRGKESEIMQRIQRDIKRDRHPKCLVQAFPSRKQGGLYVRVRSMLDAKLQSLLRTSVLSTAFFTPTSPSSCMPPTTHEIALRWKDDPGFTVPLLWKGPYLTMPIHHRITGMRKLAYTAKLPPFRPGVWVIAKEGDYSSECVVAFLPRLDLPQQKFKRVKKTHSSNPAVPATFTTPFPVSTTMSDIKSKFDFVSINTKASYPIPLERTIPSKKRSVPSACRPRPSKVCIGSTPVLKFTEFHDIPPSSISVCCAICNKGATCEHGDKEYALLKQTIWQGLSLVHQKVTNLTLANTIAKEDLLEFFETESMVLQSNIPLPSTWIFRLGERVRVSNQLRDHHRPLRENPELASELGLQSKDEGFIRDVVEINCVVEFLDGTDGEGRQVVLPQHSLLKVMRQGNEVYVCLASCSIFQLGVAEVSSTTERIPLDGKVGLVVSIGDDGETVQVQFSKYPVPQQFHLNSLVNSALMLSPNDLVKRGIKKPLPSIDPVFSIVPKTLVYVKPNPSILMTDPTPEPLDLAIHTGRRPWVGKEVRIVGLNDGGATIKHHKAENGSVLDVNRNDSVGMAGNLLRSLGRKWRK